MTVRDGAILLVEDNPDDEELTTMALRDCGVKNEIVVARDGVEAVARLDEWRSTSPLPMFVLLDLKIPRLNGFEVLRWIREHPETRSLPVVVLTSSDDRQDIARGYAEGANSYVLKPVGFDAFARAVRQLGEYWASLNEPHRT